MKAWFCYDGESAAVVYAETRGKARLLGMHELDHAYFTDGNVRRAAMLDGEPHEVTTREFWLAGGTVECEKCAQYIEAEEAVVEIGKYGLTHTTCLGEVSDYGEQ